MTPAELATEYLLREAAAHAKPEGGNPRAILESLAKEAGIPYEAAREIVLDHTVKGVGDGPDIISQSQIW